MYTAEEREQIIDIVDKMSLLRQDFDGEQKFISDLKQIVKINALKFGEIYDGVLN